MGQINRLEVIDREGWRHDFALEKAVVHLGSDSRNDIILDSTRGGNVASLHAQLILSNLSNDTSVARVQLVNLADTDIALGSANGDMLPPRSATELVDGMSFKVGEFTLILHGTATAFSPVESKGENIGLSLHLSRPRLQPNRFIDGAVNVRNGGDRTGAQIELQLEGLPATCYDLEPGPMLSSGADRQVLLRIYHRGHLPLAGSHQIIIRATAPKVYPGDEATASVKIEVAPQYTSSMRLLPPQKSLPACIQVVKPRPSSDERAEAVAEIGPVTTGATADEPTVVAKREGKGAARAGGEDWWAPTVAAVTKVESSSVDSKPVATVSILSVQEAEPAVLIDDKVSAVSSQGKVGLAEDLVPIAPAVADAPEEKALAVDAPLPVAAPAVIVATPAPEDAVDAGTTPAGGPLEAATSPFEGADQPQLIAESAETEAATSPAAQATPEEEIEVSQRLPVEEAPPEGVLPTPAERTAVAAETPSTPERSQAATPPYGSADIDPSVVEVWWQTPVSVVARAEDESTDQGVLKLRASTPSKQELPPANQASSETPTQTWWMTEEEDDFTPLPEGPVIGQSVLKLKAPSPSNRSSTSQPQPEPRSPRVVSEDWWSPSDDTEDSPHA